MFQLGFMQNAFIAGFIVSMLCPFIGLFIVLRRYSMIGDTLSHSSFAGVAIGLVLGIDPLLTAFSFTSICALVIEFLRTYYKKYAELVMSIVLTLSLGIAIILISSGKASAKVDSFLFGSILTVTDSDICLIAIVGGICLICLLFLYNKLIYVTFDENGAKTSGINVKLVNYIFYAACWCNNFSFYKSYGYPCCFINHSGSSCNSYAIKKRVHYDPNFCYYFWFCGCYDRTYIFLLYK